jgi:hypothetical protein
LPRNPGEARKGERVKPRYSTSILHLAVVALLATAAPSQAVTCVSATCGTTGWSANFTDTSGFDHNFLVELTTGPFGCNDGNGPCQTTFFVMANQNRTFMKNWPGGGCPPSSGTHANAVKVTNCDDANDFCYMSVSCP